MVDRCERVSGARPRGQTHAEYQRDDVGTVITHIHDAAVLLDPVCQDRIDTLTPLSGSEISRHGHLVDKTTAPPVMNSIGEVRVGAKKK